jgi:hypothetical protein
MKLQRVIPAALMLAAATSLLGGCGASMQPHTGFLGDYSKLEVRSATSHRYIAPGNPLRNYHRFMIDPITVYHNGDIPELTPSQVTQLKNYLHEALTKAISDRYPVVHAPGPGVARLRAAITDIKRSTWWMSIHPGTKLTGAGTGSAALEAELVDSVSGRQLAALVESQKGNQFELDTFSELDDVRDVMDDWAKRFRQRLDDAHANR